MWLRGTALVALTLSALPLAAAEWSAVVGAQSRLFFQDPAYVPQRDQDLSLVFEGEFYHDWDDGRSSVTFVPFLRLDSADPERTHADIRELLWQTAAEHWELRVGIGQVFWGVTESQHLVDVVNQTDEVENIDGEEKLGQPMVNLSLVRDWGTLDLFVLPGFRKRTYPGPHGRLRVNPAVDNDLALFESSAGVWHVDYAARWSQVIDAWDIGVSYFYGTVRDPALVPALDDALQPRVAPVYDLVHQVGLDTQLTLGAMLWKLEAVYRTGQGPDWFAATGGFEYTIAGVLGTRADLGLLAEYLYAEERVNVPTPFPDDIFLGVRLGLNDVQNTEILAGLITQRRGDGTFFNVEASRRLGENWRLEMELRAWHDIPSDNVQFFVRDDDYLGVTLLRYF